jgi:Rieske [2Fe-2S] domain
MTDVTTASADMTELGASPAAGMPRRPDYISDASGRPHIRHESQPRFPFPMPNGWFIVSKADEIAPLEVKPVYYFGRDLVLYRTAEGEARLVSAYCAHLGRRQGQGRRHRVPLPRLDL